MTMSKHEPVFPPEIFGKIIEIMEHREATDVKGSSVLAATEEHERVTTMQACALVCKTFAHFTRPYFFRKVVVGFNEGSDSELRLHYLLHAVASNPDIERHIRSVALDFGCTPPGQLMPHRKPEELERCIDFLLKFSNLDSISLSYSYSTYNTDDYTSTPEVTTLCLRMLKTYTSSKFRLRCLHAKKMRALPYPTIYACETLQTLSLDRCIWPELRTPLPQLRTLILRKIRHSISFPTFLYLPNLENLSMEHAGFKGVESQESWLSMQSPLKPSFGLLTLSFNCCDGYDKLVTYLQHHAQQDNKEPLSFLTSLSTHIDQHREVMPVFRTLPSLRHLYLRVDTSWESTLQLAELKLDGDFASGGALTELISLNLYVALHFEHKQYEGMVQSLPFLFTSIAPDNQLRHLCLKMDAPISSAYPNTGLSEPPDTAPCYSNLEILFWSSILSFLRNCTNFPRLQTLTLELLYYIPRKFSARSDEGSTPSRHFDTNPQFPVNVNVLDQEKGDFIMVSRLIDLQKAIVEIHLDITSAVGDSDCFLSSSLVRVDTISGTTITIQRCTTIVLHNSATRL